MKIIFDLDDTLYSDKNLREEREKEIHKLIKGKEKEFEELRKTCRTIESLNKLGISKNEFYGAMERVPINLSRDERLIKILKYLSERYKLIVISNDSCKLVKLTLEKLGIIDFFSEYYGGDSFVNEKPSEEAFSMVTSEDYCIGNNYKKDLLIPKLKGAKTILISDSKNENVDYVINNIYEIERLF